MFKKLRKTAKNSGTFKTCFNMLTMQNFTMHRVCFLSVVIRNKLIFDKM